MPDERDNAGRFLPGNTQAFEPGRSGNPAGRAKGLGRLVRDLVGKDMRAVVYVQRCVALGIPPELAELEQLGIELTAAQREALAAFPKVAIRDSHKAAEFLRDTGWHKPLQRVEHDGQVQVGTQDLTKMTREQLEEWLAGAELAEDDDGSAGESESPASR